jgi:hypothetical protein
MNRPTQPDALDHYENLLEPYNPQRVGADTLVFCCPVCGQRTARLTLPGLAVSCSNGCAETAIKLAAMLWLKTGGYRGINSGQSKESASAPHISTQSPQNGRPQTIAPLSVVHIYLTSICLPENRSIGEIPWIKIIRSKINSLLFDLISNLFSYSYNRASKLAESLPRRKGETRWECKFGHQWVACSYLQIAKFLTKYPTCHLSRSPPHCPSCLTKKIQKMSFEFVSPTVWHLAIDATQMDRIMSNKKVNAKEVTASVTADEVHVNGGTVMSDEDVIAANDADEDAALDLSEWALDQSFGKDIADKPKEPRVVVGKPDALTYWRTKPKLSGRFGILKIEKTRKTYLVHRSLMDDVPEAKPRILHACLSADGSTIWLWAIAELNPDFPNTWTESSTEAVEAGHTQMTRVVTLQKEQRNLIKHPGEDLGEPQWPDWAFALMVTKGFKGRLITSLKDPVLLAIRRGCAE